jgi:hypothetical protein
VLIYVAGSYAASTPEAIELNVRRACMLGRLVAHTGATPVVPHAMGFLGCYGDPTEGANDGCRERAIRCGISLAQAVIASGGKMWVIAKDDGTMSDGTRKELKAVVGQVTGEMPENGPRIRIENWAGWVREAQLQGVDIG